MTYRAVGSSTGQAEFLGVNNTDPNSADDDGQDFIHWPHTDFGAGDIPISKSKWEALNKSPTGASSLKMVHLPFALSSVSFFYNLNGVGEIDLDGCLLAKIFKREITMWNDPEILATNPTLVDENVEITVCRRTYGSSSTKSITKFLNIQCPREWDDSMVSSMLGNKWHPETEAVEGSGGMADCISTTNGAIGYLESGHGWSESLQEISLKNKEDQYVTSKYAFDNGGIASAAEDPVLPVTATADWGHVEFINMGGRKTFPIVLMSYVYVRTDIAEFMQDVHERGLLRLFLESLYMDEYIGVCKKLAFSPVPRSILETAKDGIEQEIKWQFPPKSATDLTLTNPWEFEIGTRKLEGTGNYMISSKRKSYQGVVINDVMDIEEDLAQEVAGLDEFGRVILTFTEKDNARINAAVTLSAISFTLWCLTFVGFVVRRYLCGGSGTKYSPPVDQQAHTI